MIVSRENHGACIHTRTSFSVDTDLRKMRMVKSMLSKQTIDQYHDLI